MKVDSHETAHAPLMASVVAGDGPADHTESSQGRFKCRNPLFAAIFVAQVGVLGFYASSSVSKKTDQSLSGDADWMTGTAVGCLIGAALFGAFLCAVWFRATLHNAKRMLVFSFKVWAVLYILGALLFFSCGQLWGGLVCLLGLLGLWCIWMMSRHRIEFAAANLTVACAALKVHPGCMLVVLSGMVASVAWVFLWLFGAIGVIEANRNEDDDDGSGLEVNPLVGLALLVSFYWGGIVASNVAHVTVSGTVASWWFRPAHEQDPGAVCGAAWRATTSSFGSICLGSLLVAVLEAVRFLLRSVQRENKNPIVRCMACCAECILRHVEAWLQYINRYAFTYVAIYGDDFFTAGARVRELFNHRGFFNTVVNDVVLSRCLSIGVLGIALFTGAFTFGVATLSHAKHAVALGLFGLLAGWLLANVTMGALSSAVATVYVAFGEDPSALKHNHPAEFDVLYQSWHQFYPAAVTYVVLV